MTMIEFPINLDIDAEGLGNLIITDAQLLIRPARPSQYHQVPHDSAHAYGILNLGNDMGVYNWHIISHIDVRSTQRLLDRVFYAYVDGCCLQLWCDAIVDYSVDFDEVATKEYGFEDGEYTMRFIVHCNVPQEETEAFVAKLIRGENRGRIVSSSFDPLHQSSATTYVVTRLHNRELHPGGWTSENAKSVH